LEVWEGFCFFFSISCVCVFACGNKDLGVFHFFEREVRFALRHCFTVCGRSVSPSATEDLKYSLRCVRACLAWVGFVLFFVCGGLLYC
jgi:hypothetical protein